MYSEMPSNTYNCNNARLFSDLMKITVLIESLSLKQSNVLYKRKTLPGKIFVKLNGNSETRGQNTCYDASNWYNSRTFCLKMGLFATIANSCIIACFSVPIFVPKCCFDQLLINFLVWAIGRILLKEIFPSLLSPAGIYSRHIVDHRDFVSFMYISVP